MQNKAKFQKSRMNVNNVLTKRYDKLDTWSSGKKQSQTNPNKAKSRKAKMNVTFIITKVYENKSPFWGQKKQSQFSLTTKTNAILFDAKDYEKNRAFVFGQNKPKQTQFVVSLPNLFPNCPKQYFLIAISGKIKMFIQSNLAEIAFAIITERALL